MCKYITENGESCDKPGRYNYIDQKPGIYCRDHKKDRMVYRTNPLCSDSKCKSYASYSATGSGYTHCAVHASEGMFRTKYKKRHLANKTNKKYDTRKRKAISAKCFIIYEYGSNISPRYENAS